MKKDNDANKRKDKRRGKKRKNIRFKNVLRRIRAGRKRRRRRWSKWKRG